jgi:hypothetical protein
MNLDYVVSILGDNFQKSLSGEICHARCINVDIGALAYVSIACSE